MQHLLDFIREHSADSQVYVFAGALAGDPELLWQRQTAPHHWQVRPYSCEGPAQLVHQTELLAALSARRVDMSRLERELEIVCAAQIAYADMVLNAARELLGSDAVQRVVHEHRAFLGELQAVAERLTQAPPAPPSMALVRGGRARTQARSGHLSVVKTTTSEL